MRKTKQVMAGITATAMLAAITGCSGIPEPVNPVREWDEEMAEQNQDWSSGEDLPPVPEDSSCTEWEWEAEDGVWECDEVDSPYFGHYFFSGMFFANRALLYNNSDYMKYKKSPAFKGARLDSKYKNTNPNGSSGFGTGSRSSTGG